VCELLAEWGLVGPTVELSLTGEVRGPNLAADDCRTGSWLPLAGIPPPVPCPGCGRQIDQPYGPRELRFSYRLGEPLRRVLETDSLGPS